jgi:hypothetical protein
MVMSFKQFLVAEAYQTKYRLFWFNPKSKKFVSVTTTYHDQEIIKNPKPFGLTKDDINKVNPDAEFRDSDLFPRLNEPLFKAGWAKLSHGDFSGGSMNIKATSLKFAAAVAKAWIRQFPEVPKKTYIDYGSKSETLDKVQLRGLARTGRIPQPSAVAAFR